MFYIVLNFNMVIYRNTTKKPYVFIHVRDFLYNNFTYYTRNIHSLNIILLIIY